VTVQLRGDNFLSSFDYEPYTCILEIGRKLGNNSLSREAFLVLGFRTASLRSLGIPAVCRERLIILVTVGSNSSMQFLKIQPGIGSKIQDFPTK
jgi:hypothetical protein